MDTGLCAVRVRESVSCADTRGADRDIVSRDNLFLRVPSLVPNLVGVRGRSCVCFGTGFT